MPETEQHVVAREEPAMPPDAVPIEPVHFDEYFDRGGAGDPEVDVPVEEPWALPDITVATPWRGGLVLQVVSAG